LSAKEKWEDAREILERGVGVDDEIAGEDDGESTEEGETGEKVPNPVNVFPAYKTAYALGETGNRIPLASGLIRSMLEKSPLTSRELYEYSLQLRMTLVKVVEVIEGPEGAERMWVDVFRWMAERRGVGQGSERESLFAFENLGTELIGYVDSHRLSVDSPVPPSMMDKSFVTRNTHTQVPVSPTTTADANANVTSPTNGEEHDATESLAHGQTQPQLIAPTPIPITISPATPTTTEGHFHGIDPLVDPLDDVLSEKSGGGGGEKKTANGLKVKRSSLSMDRGSDTMKSNKKVLQVQQMLKDRVHKGRQGITAVSRKIGHGVVRGHHRRFGPQGRGIGVLRMTNSTPGMCLFCRISLLTN
jgi:hypothetical protein